MPLTQKENGMPKWEAEWLLNNPGGSRHGATGTVIVQGTSERDAEETARDTVSRKLCGTTEMQEKVQVRTLREEQN